MTKILKNKEPSCYLPVLNDFNPLYATVGPQVLEACHRALLEGERCCPALENRSDAWIKTAFDLSSEAEQHADRFLSLTPKAQLSYPWTGLSDFTLATLYGILMEWDVDEDIERLSSLADQLLMAVLTSPTAVPLLDYGWMFTDAVQYHIPDRLGRDPVALMKRALAHDIAHNRGEHVVDILHHLASVYVECDMFEPALETHLSVLHYDPGRFESYAEFAFDLARDKRFEAALKVGGRGLAVLSATPSGDRGEAESLEMSMASWRSAAQTPRAVSVSEGEMQAIDAAMNPAGPGSPSLIEVVYKLVPDIDEIPVKGFSAGVAVR